MSKSKTTQTHSEKTSNKTNSKVSAKSVSRRWINAVSRDRNADLPAKQLLLRYFHRSNVISREHDTKLTNLRQKYIKEEQINSRALELYNNYVNLGVTWAACVQAVKTDWVSQFQEKWRDKSKQAKQQKTR